MGDCWTVSSPLIFKNIKTYIRALRGILSVGETDGGIKRFQFSVKSEFKWANRWAKSLGFHQESTMESWGADGKDYKVFVRLA